MNLQLTGHHLEITPAIRDHITSKLEKINRHFDNIIDTNVILSTDKLQHKIEITVNLPGKKPLHIAHTEPDMYAAIDVIIDKLDRQILKEKEKMVDRRAQAPSVKNLSTTME